MIPINPLYQHLPTSGIACVLALVMACVTLVAVLKAIVGTWWKLSSKSWPYFSRRPVFSFPLGEISVYGLGLVLYGYTGEMIYLHHQRTDHMVALVMVALAFHAMLVYGFWLRFRSLPISDMVVMIATSLNLATYLAGMNLVVGQNAANFIQGATVDIILGTLLWEAGRAVLKVVRYARG